MRYPVNIEVIAGNSDSTCFNSVIILLIVTLSAFILFMAFDNRSSICVTNEEKSPPYRFNALATLLLFLVN